MAHNIGSSIPIALFLGNCRGTLQPSRSPFQLQFPLHHPPPFHPPHQFHVHLPLQSRLHLNLLHLLIHAPHPSLCFLPPPHRSPPCLLPLFYLPFQAHPPNLHLPQLPF